MAEDKDTIDQQPEVVEEHGQAVKLPAERKTTELATAPSVSMTSQELITYALTNDKLDALDKLIALKNAEEDRAARLEFERHFAEMQKDYKPVKRASVNKQFNSPYADLNDIMAVYGPILAKHGFSTTWEESLIPEQPGWKLITSLISGYGYTKKASFPCPPLESNGVNEKGNEKGANAIQRQGIQTAYGRRQSFTSNAGVIQTDEDQDGGTFDDGIAIANHINLIREATTQAQRKAAYMAAINSKDLTDKQKALIAEESKKKNKAMADAGVTA